ncbi:hypothetical protein ABTX60_27395 [Streptomyces sp. NPDC126510]|uniref:hypothetical protein n=1 Tax=Streptomyces sp. NPDC126510 TaxID=3155317 RepID=UPI00332EA929
MRSRARRVLCGDAHRPRRLGVTAWHATKGPHTGTMTQTWRRRTLLGAQPRAGGRTNWFVCRPRCAAAGTGVLKPPHRPQAPGGLIFQLVRRLRTAGTAQRVR